MAQVYSVMAKCPVGSAGQPSHCHIREAEAQEVTGRPVDKPGADPWAPAVPSVTTPNVSPSSTQSGPCLPSLESDTHPAHPHPGDDTLVVVGDALDEDMNKWP